MPKHSALKTLSENVMSQLTHRIKADKVLVNKFNPKKLLNSKWTALNPQNKELHFIVVKLIESAFLMSCMVLSSWVLSNRIELYISRK